MEKSTSRDERLITISLFASKSATVPEVTDLSWTDLCRHLSTPAVREEKDGPLFSPALFYPAYRLKKNVRSVSLLVLDCDHGADVGDSLRLWADMGLACLSYTTHSHLRRTDSNPGAEPRFRIVVPLAEPIPADLYPALWRWAAAQCGGRIDEAAKDSSRMFYLPAKYSQAAEFDFRV